MMDADYDKTDRFNLAYRIDKISDLISSLSFQLYYTKVDHWMDDRFRKFMTNPSGPYSMATDAQTKNLWRKTGSTDKRFCLGL